MKKILWIAVLAVAYIYLSGYYSLSEAGANRFLNAMETASQKGDAEAICDMLADNVEVSIQDRSTRAPVSLTGGKEQLCSMLKKTMPMQAALIASTQVTRDNLKVERGWLHCWTADVSYTEHRTIILQRAGMTVRTVSDDKLTLVKTLTHVVIKRIEASIRIDNGT
jgi:hypothetical protein